MLMQPEQPIQPTYAPPPMPVESGRFSSKQKKLIIAVGILLLLFIIIMIASSIFGGQSSPTEKSLTSVTARNSEILRVIEALEENLSTSEGKAYAAQTKILLTSDNIQLINYTISQYSATHSAEQIANTELQKTGSDLAARSAQGDFDDVFISTIQFEIELNKTLLEQLDPETLGPNLRIITDTAIFNYNSLL